MCGVDIFKPSFNELTCFSNTHARIDIYIKIVDVLMYLSNIYARVRDKFYIHGNIIINELL